MIIADLHIHSKYSRATSRECDPQHLDLWARRKGIDLLGTGDFTHPAWRAQLREQLLPAEEGLYVLDPALRLGDGTAGNALIPRFVVTGEISSIYKKGGRVRKVHNLILLPSLEAADLLSRRLEAIGNIHSDGRPILGLDCRDLLEITLEACPEAILIPAHIWTPHFSLFGAFSGFDSIEECFGDLTCHIHALETGLSSDPPMNHRISALDRYLLVSNSDAHSPSKLGREANLLETGLSYPSLARALTLGAAGGFRGTVEFFPEEGKYHWDGHRKCGVCLTPAAARELDNKCPVCGRPLTIGVQHRTEELADRPEGFVPQEAPPFESLAPLPQVIAASTGLSPASLKVNRRYEAMLEQLGPEFHILRRASLSDVERAAGPCVMEGLRRLRLGQVERIPGYDGEYGTIRLLAPEEIEAFSGQISLFGVAKPRSQGEDAGKKGPSPAKGTRAPAEPAAPPPEAAQALNPGQQAAVSSGSPVVIVQAGPGTGKTKTLTARMLHLTQGQGVPPSQITAVTFTNHAAGELRRRLEKALGGKRRAAPFTIGTFHSICLELLSQRGPVHLISQEEALELVRAALEGLPSAPPPSQALREISRRKNGGSPQDSLPDGVMERYQLLLKEAGVLDFDDLLTEALTLWNRMTPAERGRQRRFTHLLVDEFQDCSPVQYQLVLAWSQGGRSLFVIGDPDQAIYGFRGADPGCFQRLIRQFPQADLGRLDQNYRSTPQILRCAPCVLDPPAKPLLPARPQGLPVALLTAQTPLQEAVFVAKEIGRMVGGMDMMDAQALPQPAGARAPRGFSEIAVLYRTRRQALLLEKCLRRDSIPCTVSGRDSGLDGPPVQGALAFFRFLLSPGDTVALAQCLRQVWGCPPDLVQGLCAAWGASHVKALPSPQAEEALAPYRGISHLARWLDQTEKYLPRAAKALPHALLEEWARDNGLEKDPGIRRLLEHAAFHKSMAGLLAALLLGREQDLTRCPGGKPYSAGAVSLMTLHASKGLEFPVVFLCGVSQGVIPLESARGSWDPQEERRLLYVGMTRAREELIILTSPQPSPFLQGIPGSQLASGPVHVPAARPAALQMSLFD